MDKHVKYRKILLSILREKEWSETMEGETLSAKLIADEKADRYIMIAMGWRDRLYYHTVYFQLDIIDGKVWFQQNNTEEEIVDELMEAGIPATDIILGFIPEEARTASGFAIN